VDFQLLNPARLVSRFWGRKITDSEGMRRDTGVTEAMEEVAAVMGARQSIDLTNGPIVINNMTNGPAIVINNLGTENQTEGVQITNEAGESTGLGIGVPGNYGIIANEYIPISTYSINPQYLQYYFYEGAQITYQQAIEMGIPVPPEGPGRNGRQVIPGFSYQTGQPYPPGSQVGGGATGGQVGGTGGEPGNPFTLYPPFTLNPILTGNPPPPSGQIVGSGFTGDVEVVTDVTDVVLDEDTCTLTFTLVTKTLGFVDGLLKTVTE
jgi:hypothetical protein